MNVRLTHIDGKLPNLALMKLSHWHKAQGDTVHLSRFSQPTMFEDGYDVVYGSAIFSWSQKQLARMRWAWPNALLGGTGSESLKTVEEVIGSEYENYDYSIYPNYPYSIGFTQRGCRLNCSFCIVPQKEGRPRSVNTIWDIWRPETERCIILLDNDFFGQEESQWRARVSELIEGDFKVSFNQGINIRLVTDEVAEALARVRYYDDQFQVRRLYTAWDNLGQERIFFQGLERLQRVGIPARHLMVYMLIGFAKGETMEAIMYRYKRLKESGVMPYPMVYNNQEKSLKKFQRWVVRRYDEIVPWERFSGMAAEAAERA